jgi:hypothetical protein
MDFYTIYRFKEKSSDVHYEFMHVITAVDSYDAFQQHTNILTFIVENFDHTYSQYPIKIDTDTLTEFSVKKDSIDKSGSIVPILLSEYQVLDFKLLNFTQTYKQLTSNGFTPSLLTNNKLLNIKHSLGNHTTPIIYNGNPFIFIIA